MRCVFNNQVLEVIERTRMQARPDADWGSAGPEPINGRGGDTPHNSSRRSSPMSSGRPGGSGLNTPLISPASTPGKEERPGAKAAAAGASSRCCGE